MCVNTTEKFVRKEVYVDEIEREAVGSNPAWAARFFRQIYSSFLIILCIWVQLHFAVNERFIFALWPSLILTSRGLSA
jgi:hypothetical protein